MASIRKVWLNPHGGGVVNMGIESCTVDPPHYRVHVRENLFPAEPTPEHPLRHTVNVGLFDDTDLRQIRDAIDDYLEQSESNVVEATPTGMKDRIEVHDRKNLYCTGKTFEEAVVEYLRRPGMELLPVKKIVIYQ